MALSDRQKKHLRRLGHELHPIVLIGQRGLTGSVIAEFDRALADHELVKLRARVGDRDERDRLLAELAAATRCELVHRIGNVGLFYRKNNALNAILLPDS